MTNAATFDRGFQVEEQGDGLLITGKGAGLSIGRMILLFCPLLFLAMPTAFYLVNGPLGLLPENAGYPLGVLINVAVLWGINRLKSPQFAFRLLPSGLQREGKLYPYQEIGEIFIDNPHMKGQTFASGGIVPGFVVAGSGPAGMTAALSMVTAADTASRIIRLGARMGASINYRINMRHGNRIVRLATSLDENTALSLFGFLMQDA